MFSSFLVFLIYFKKEMLLRHVCFHFSLQGYAPTPLLIGLSRHEKLAVLRAAAAIKRDVAHAPTDRLAWHLDKYRVDVFPFGLAFFFFFICVR